MSDPTPDPHAVETTGDSPAGSSAEKDNSNWVTGDEPMTGPQASYLETLAHQAGEEPPTDLTKAQASDEIERLQGAVTPGGSSGDGDGDGDGGGTPDLSRQERPTDQWVTGDEPMTGPQASYLETLAQQAGEEPPTGLNKSQASRAIDELRQKTSR
ncbi:DUF3072 domain-containing protein [Actinomycetospora lemnae]